MVKDGNKIGGTIMAVIGGLMLAAGLFLSVGFLFLRGAIIHNHAREMEEMYKFARDAEKTWGTVYEVDDIRNESTTVAYEVEDQKYYAKFDVVDRRYNVRNTLWVYYRPEDPNQCVAPDLYENAVSDHMIFMWLHVFVGIFVSVLGFGILMGGRVLLRKSKPRV